MSTPKPSNVTQADFSMPNTTVPLSPPEYRVGPPLRPYAQLWAPAWFYSAINWLGRSYNDASNVQQSFNRYMVGSDVDPYAHLGSTRLFMIFQVQDNFILTLATDVDSAASMSSGSSYPNTDVGIKEMYIALSTSAIFSSVKYCYIPGRIGPDLNPYSSMTASVAYDLQAGYDPLTGLRTVVLGSAVSQVVPIDDFLKTQNEQIYDDDPTIVPIVSALVYDVTQNNELGATTFVLPIYYTRDQVSQRNYYVSKLGASTLLNNITVEYGQTAIFPGGPGYNESVAIPLTLVSSIVANSNGYMFTTNTFDKAVVVTTGILGSKVQAGVMSLTYAGDLPSEIFSKQQIIGFYRDSSWVTCLGVPIYDFGSKNASFTATSVALNDPVLIYDPNHPFLSGGSLLNVLQKLGQAKYLYSSDRLRSMLNGAIGAQDSNNGVGLSVTTTCLGFDLSSAPASPIVDQLAVPILGTITTNPPAIELPFRPIEGLTLLGGHIGVGANAPRQGQQTPVTVQIGLSAFVPREALDNTGITSIEIGTEFPQYPLGLGTELETTTAGIVINLTDHIGGTPAFDPYDLATATAGVLFTVGVSYALSLTGTNLTSRGSDGSSSSSSPTASTVADPNHTFVGAMVYTDATTSVRLYPKLQLSLPAPAVALNGIQQGVKYSIRLTFGDSNSQYDIIDSTQTVLESDISVPNPTPTDGSNPQQNDLYFGSFIGGSNQMTVWSVPVFLTIAPSDLHGVSFNGDMILDTVVSGVPSYQLQITDSSLFVYSNINVDTSSIGSVSSNDVFLAGAVINASPDNKTAAAFAPCKLLLGLVRQVQMESVSKYVFVPEDDSVVIGSTRYMLSIIDLVDLTSDPNLRPYPPIFWPRTRFWQFANRHNPYIDVGYKGASQQDRISNAQADTARIGLQVAQTQEPMQMYLDTNRELMTVWPICGFPLTTSTQTVDQGQLKEITSTILEMLKTSSTTQTRMDRSGSLDSEQILVPDFLQQNNPYDKNLTTASKPNSMFNTSFTVDSSAPTIPGLRLKTFGPSVIGGATGIHGIEAKQSYQVQQNQEASANFAKARSVMQVAETSLPLVASTGVTIEGTSRRMVESIYGFSVYNPRTSEAYIIEVVEADMDIPDQIPNTTEHADYDPYYVRVVFLSTLTCYNMTIIVPSILHDQYGHFGRQRTLYQNLLSKTNELGIGYLYSLYNGTDNFDNVNLNPYPATSDTNIAESESVIFTNIPYSADQSTSFAPASLFRPISKNEMMAVGGATSFDASRINYSRLDKAPLYFVCRRQNWSADCHLMQATNVRGSSVYLGFGAGDIIPLRLDADFKIDKRAPDHLHKLTYTFADRKYDSAKTISVGNKPYFVAVTTDGGLSQYMNFSINDTAGTADLQISSNHPLKFPPDCYVVGQASATLTSLASISSPASPLVDTGSFMNKDDAGNIIGQEFQLIPFNNLVYLIRAVSNVQELSALGGLGVVSGLLVDTYVPSTTGNLTLARGARHKRSGLQFFGSTYTPTTMVDTLDTLDFTSITGEPFYVPTIFIPIPEIDSTKGFVADLSNFLGQQIWTFIYPEIVAQMGTTVNGVTYPNGFNLDVEGKPILSLQKLHFIYDPLVVMFTPNDLAHKYQLQPKQQVLALTNGQIQEGICWRSANVQPQRLMPTNICAQQILLDGDGIDRANIVYSSHNRPVATSNGSGYQGMSINSFRSVSGVVYNIEELALSDQTRSTFISAVSSASNMLIGVLFDYDNNDLGTLDPYNETESTKGIVFINGYLGATGYSFSSPDHFDVNDVLPSQLPLLEQVAGVLGVNWDVAFYDTDVSLPRQFWSLVFDTFTASGLPNYIVNVPPSKVDPTFTNRTRSLILSLQNPVRPQELGLMDTYTSVVSANLHLQNGVTGSVFLSKKADRDVASIGTSPAGSGTPPLFGLPTKYDFFIFSRDHYWTLKDAKFELIDQGYAMCLVDDGSGTGGKVAKYYIDADGNYNELYTYVLSSSENGIIEAATFTLKVTLGTPANLSATPIIAETPNNVNPQDLVTEINKVSALVYAAFGPLSKGQSPAFIPIQAVGGEVQAAPILGPPAFGGYSLNVVTTNRQPVQITQIYSGSATYAIAGPTTILPINPMTSKVIPFFGSLSHGLDKQVDISLLQSADLKSFIPRLTHPLGPTSGVFGGNGQGALIGTEFSCAFQGVGAIPPAILENPTPGTTMAGDDEIFYTFNAVVNAIMDSNGKSGSVGGGQYFVDTSDPLNPIFAVVTLPSFVLDGNSYTFNLSTTLVDGVTPCYTLIVAGKSYLFDSDNAHVNVDKTRFTFNPLNAGNYTVTHAAVDDLTGNQSPTPIILTPFSIAAGGLIATIDIFTNPDGLRNIVLGVTGREYAYDPVHATVTITDGVTTTTVPVFSGLTFTSTTGYGYVIGCSNAGYTVNGGAMFPYSSSTIGDPASYALLTSPQMFTIGGNFYLFDQDAKGSYVSVTGNSETIPVNPYQFSINGDVYILNTNVQPNTVIGGGNIYTMTAGNTQFLVNGAQYTIVLKQNSLAGATISGQFNVTQGNVVVIENYVYNLDTLNGQIVGNGTTYPLTNSGFTYTITTTDASFTVTTAPNATTATIGNVVYLIDDTTVVGDGIAYPILPYRTFVDGVDKFDIEPNGIVSIASALYLSGSYPFVRSTFTDIDTYTVNDFAAFDGTTYHLISGSLPEFTTPTFTYTLRSDGIAINAGASKTYIVNTTGPLSPNEFSFGTKTIHFGRVDDLAAFDGHNYFAISSGQFTDSNTNLSFTLSGNTAVNEGNSYEIFSNLGQGSYFEIPGGPTYYVDIAVADTVTATGDVYSVFPISGGQFAIPLIYTITVSGSNVTVNSSTFVGGPTGTPTLTASAGTLTGGFFKDPITNISYICINNGGVITFVDSNNVTYPFDLLSAPNTFIATIIVATGENLAVDNQVTPSIYPILNNQFIVDTATYSINVLVAYVDSVTGPFFPMVNGRFIAPRVDPLSNLSYTVKGGSVIKGYLISSDDEFSIDGNVVYTINAINVVKATNQATLSGSDPVHTIAAGAYNYTLDSTKSLATIDPLGLTYNTLTKEFTLSYNGLVVTYTVGSGIVTDDRHPTTTFLSTLVGSQLTFFDTVNSVTFTFDESGNNQITAGFTYTNHFFVDIIINVTYFIDQPDNRVEAISYLSVTTRYAFVPADGRTYLIHYDDVSVIFPVISGTGVNVGVATVGSDTFTVHVDEVDPVDGGVGISINQNSFEINGSLYTIAGTPTGTDYSSCQVIGDTMAPNAFISANSFKLTDPNVTYTLQLDASNLPTAVLANFMVMPSRNLISVNDNVYIVTYNTSSTGSLLGQGQLSIAITNSTFTLTNSFDTTKAKFIFADLNIFDSASVIGEFTVYLAPTFFIANATYTFDTVNLIVIDNGKRSFPILTNPSMFCINGYNYVIDTNRTPHAIVGNNNISPLSTDVTVERGGPIPNSTFTLNGLIYKYTEDALHNLVVITGTKSYMVAQPDLTFKLDSSLVFTIIKTPPAVGNYAGSNIPIGTITARSLALNLYPGIPESGNADFFIYKNLVYTLVQSAGVYLAVQKSYTVYVAEPTPNQQQLAVFDLNGVTYLVTDGSTAGAPNPLGVNPGTIWAETSMSSTETQFGLVYGFGPQPLSVHQSATGQFQFQVSDASGHVTLYDILYSLGSNANRVKVDIPALLPTFTQYWVFDFTPPSYPLQFETGGYNAFTTFVAETSIPSESFAGAFKTPITSTDARIDTLVTSQGDFSLEFWHSIPMRNTSAYHPFTYSASTSAPLVYYVDVDFDDRSNIYLRINNTVMHTATTHPVLTSGWRHFALTYDQPYVMKCGGAGFEVKKAANYNFNRDFSIAMTFRVSDPNTNQGLLYKGTGSDITSPELAMSYRVAVNSGAVTLTITDGANEISREFTGQPVIEADTFYKLIIVKHTTTPAGRSDSADPYAAPFDVADLGKAAAGGINLTTTGSGPITVSNITPAGEGATTKTNDFINSIQSSPSDSYNVIISVRTINDDGSFGAWQTLTTNQPVSSGDPGLLINPTGSAHLLIGSAFNDRGQAMPLGNLFSPAEIRKVYLFNGAINRHGITTKAGLVDIADASSDDLLKAGVVGVWSAEYDPNGIVNNPFDQSAFASSTNTDLAQLVPLSGQEFEAVNIYVNGHAMPLQLVNPSDVPYSMSTYSEGSSSLVFNAGIYKLAEISMWSMARQPYQIIDDMFGRLILSNEPSITIYLSGSFEVQPINAPILPMNKYIDNISVLNPIATMALSFSSASRDLTGCPAVGRCGPLVTPNLYTPPGVALTVCDTVPYLTTYSLTLNNLTTSLAGVINEAYVYVKDNVLTLYAGKKVGDLTLTWVSQEQGDVQLIGYIEGAPPCPMANLTNKPAYPGATSVTLSAPTSVTMKYQANDDFSDETKWDFGDKFGMKYGLGLNIAPFGLGVKTDNSTLSISGTFGASLSIANSAGNGTQSTASNKLDESNKYTVKMQGSLSPYTGDLFMANLNSLTTPSTTAGNPSSNTAILPNPNLGGFTTSNPPNQLPKTAPTDEKFGSRMYVPSPYGQAFVTSETLDVYQQKLLQSNTVYGFVRIPDRQIPRDLNIVSFRMSSKYIRQGCLDGVVGYVYNPATLPNGSQTYATSTGEMQVLYDKNFAPGLVGHDASYMRVVEAYKLKKQIDQEAFNALALYQTAYNTSEDPSDSRLTPGLDFYDEYVWSSRGGSQEVKHTYTTSFDEVYTTTTVNTTIGNIAFNIKLSAATITVVDAKLGWTETIKDTIKYSYNTTGTSSFDISASFDGIESDTQMRYSSANDAHFIMNYNSMFNSNNQSGLNLVIGSDGLIYRVAPSVSSGAGQPSSDNIDDAQTYTQPQPGYSSGNADGLTGSLEPYDRPGKTKLFRTYSYFLQPRKNNADDFWNTVIDPLWLANSDEADADAMRSAMYHVSMPWRLLYRVTYSERFLPPVATGAIVVPQITPVMAIPVLNPASDFLFNFVTANQQSLHNPANDIEANIVLAAPTASGISAGDVALAGFNTGETVLPNNVIPFDLVKGNSTVVNWGDSNNVKLLAQMTASVLGLSTVSMSTRVPLGSTKISDIANPIGGGLLYSVYTDPNGLTINVPTDFSITVYQDVNANPIQYFDGKSFYSLQADYIATTDGTVMYYVQPPSTYDQNTFDLLGDYDLFGHPGDEWRYYLVSGFSANMTAEPTVSGVGAFLSSTGATPYTGFTVANSQYTAGGLKQVQGYVLVQGVLQWPHLNTNAQTFADILIYKAMSLLDTFPLGDPEILISFLKSRYPEAPFVVNDEINLVFAKNIVSFFSDLQQAMVSQ